MIKTKQNFYVALAFALLLVMTSPVRSEDQGTDAATTPDNGSDEMQSPATSSEVETATPEEETKAPAATHHTAKKKKHTTHHKHAKKKKAHKTAKKHHAKKAAKKTHAVHHHKAVKKATPAKPKEVEKEALPPKTENEEDKPIPLAPVHKEAREKVKPAPKEVMAAPVVHEPSHKEKTASSGGGKTVTYTFCLGYENCVPHRYEAVMHGGTVDAKVFKETGDRDWTEAKLDPVMAGDLGSMARTESGSDVARPLTVTEKARIADHQGKVHVDLVSAANDGNKEQVKQMLRNLNIHNGEELQTYDARLAKNEVAVQAANELASGR